MSERGSERAYICLNDKRVHPNRLSSQPFCALFYIKIFVHIILKLEAKRDFFVVLRARVARQFAFCKKSFVFFSISHDLDQSRAARVDGQKRQI